MMCDVLIAADTAKFGQPDRLGVLPVWAARSATTRAIGKAMDDDPHRTHDRRAAEAERSGLVSRVVAADQLLDEANAVATTISQMSRSAARMARRRSTALRVQSRRGSALRTPAVPPAFATDDQSEGMAAFTEKRAPTFAHR